MRIIGVIFFWLMAASAFAQVKVTIVSAGTGEKLEGVSVVIQEDTGSSQTFISDESGSIVIPAIHLPLTLTASHLGFVNQQLRIESAGDYILKLEVSVSILDQVVVTGQFEPQSVSKSVFKVRVIPAEMIEAKGASRLQDVLNTEMNIRFENDPALGVSNLSMQGMGGQNVKVLIDGVPVIGRQGTDNSFDINQININTIDRIEIIEGPMSTIYGADALAGVINIITKKPEQTKFTTHARIHEESIGNEYSLFTKGIHQEGVGLSYRKDAFSTSADFGFNDWGGWQGAAAGRDKQYNPKTQWLSNALVAIDQSNWNAYYRIDFLNENIYNPGTFQGNAALDQHFITNRFIHQLQGGVKLTDNLGFTGALTYSDYKRRTQTTIVDATTGEETLSLGQGHQDETKFDGLMVRGTFQYKIHEMLSLQPGYDLNFETGEGGRLEEGRNQINDYALFLSAEFKPLPYLNIRPGVRFVKNSVYQAPPALPSVNIKLDLSSRHEIRMSYGRGFRAPSLRELYFYFFDSNHSIKGNPNLEAELSHSYNASWDWHLINKGSFRYTTSLSIFYNKLNNMITTAMGSDNIFTYSNISKSRTQGIVLNNKIHFGKLYASAGFGYTARYNPFTDEDPSLEEVTWSPEINTSLSYSFSKIGLTTSLFYKYTGETPYYAFNATTNEIYLAETSDYHWADISIEKSFLKYFSLTLGSRNLFDVTTVNDSSIGGGAHSTVGARAIGSGRSYYATLSMNF